MNLKILNINKTEIAQLETDQPVINTVDDALDLIGNSGYLGVRKIIIRKQNLADEFFDLKTKLAGEILQKFSNYRMQVAIVGDFDTFKSESLRDFIFESNKAGRVFFTDSIDEAGRLLSTR